MAHAQALSDADTLVEPAIELVRSWLVRADELETRADRENMKRLEGVVTNADAVDFVMRFVDRVVRPEVNLVAANQLAAVVNETSVLPPFLSRVDQALLRAGAILGPKLPHIVVPLARRRMRSIVGHLVAPSEPDKLASHLAHQRNSGYALNVNVLGEAVLGENEAERRLAQLMTVIDQPDVDYVSVKISSVASQLNHFAHADSLRRIVDRIRVLLTHAAKAEPATFVNFDMEEYHDLNLTLEAFIDVLSEESFHHLDAGIVLQTYLPDSFPALERLVTWANARHRNGGGTVKIRLVKGANLAMEKVDAAMHGWQQAPYGTKVETDANYKRCLEWLLVDDRLAGVRVGIASHNLFDVAWASLVAGERGVSDRVQFEMLQGMAPAQATTVAERGGADEPLLVYTPAVAHDDFDVAISYLFRRLEENASDENFLRHLFDLTPTSPAFDEQANLFRESMTRRNDVSLGARRTQNRKGSEQPPYVPGEPFRNESDTDPTLPANHEWISAVAADSGHHLSTPLTTEVSDIEARLKMARSAQVGWAATSGTERQQLLHSVGDKLAERRGTFISTMMREANKTFEQADVEVSEAIDFARYYGDRAVELDQNELAKFTPFGIVGVVPPWNFPVAIPAGGVLSSLAAGNSVIFKPAPETAACAEVIVEACWEAGVNGDVLQFVRTPDDHVGQHLVTNVDAVILTGAGETAELFQSWKPNLRLFAETSGKNALIITPNADLDLAVADLVASAFGHAGQKCSAASLAILVGGVAKSERFRRQLIDAVESIAVGESTDLETTMSPLISPANDRLKRGLTSLDAGEHWLVEPQQLDDDGIRWTPGVRDGVGIDSWFGRTECFGPVLGLVAAQTLEEAIDMVNSGDLGLTGGIHSLDPAEIDLWQQTIEVGNGYINRGITGAIVQRQPFGGWKKSNVGPGAKAGGPNYVAQLGRWEDHDDRAPDTAAPDDYADQWQNHFSVSHDPTDLFCEANVFRYRPLDEVLVRFEADATERERTQIRKAAKLCGVRLTVSNADDEDPTAFISRVTRTTAQRVRYVGGVPSEELLRVANGRNIHIAAEPVTSSGRVELQHYLREQAMSETLHRFGNLHGAAVLR